MQNCSVIIENHKGRKPFPIEEGVDYRSAVDKARDFFLMPAERIVVRASVGGNGGAKELYSRKGAPI